MPTSPADRSALRGLTSLFLGLFSIPSLGYGVYLAWCWVRVHTSDIYYADYGYARAALAFLGFGLIGLWATFYGVWRRSFYGVLLVVPILIGITVMVAIPNVLPRGYSCMADSNYFSDVNAFLRVWYETHHRFPADVSEFGDAKAQGPAAWQYRVGPVPESKYKERSTSLPYQIVVVASADGPRLTDISQRPGVIYYCVSKDFQEFWLTISALQSDVQPMAQIGRVACLPNEQIQLLHRQGRDYPVQTP